MRYTQLLLVFCAIMNIYHSRYTILQLTDTCLQTIVWFLTDIHHYLQQQIDSSKVVTTCNETIIDNNYNYNLSEYEYKCPQHRYSIQVITRQPLIIYIKQFLTPDEIQHLIELANPIFQHSSFVQADKSFVVDINYRSSTTAHIGRSPTPVVKCIEQRFAQFQGDIDPLRVEPLQVVKYVLNQEFKPHNDWFCEANELVNGGQRLTTFFTYLYANCTKGETEFVNVRFNHIVHSRLCEILICDKTVESHGIRFRPIPGNSIFWYNVDDQGRGDNMSFHAGRPPGENGHKLALNAWTRESIFTMPTDATN